MGFNAVRMSQKNMEKSYVVKLFLTLLFCFACMALSGAEARAQSDVARRQAETGSACAAP